MSDTSFVIDLTYAGKAKLIDRLGERRE
jgi:hypothetical protein